MASHMNFWRLAIATNIGLALLASAAAVPADTKTERAGDLENLVKELRSAADAANTAAIAASSRLSEGVSDDFKEQTLNDLNRHATAQEQLSGQQAGETNRGVNRPRSGSYTGYREEGITSATNTGIIPPPPGSSRTGPPSTGTVSSRDSPSPRYSGAQDPRVTAGPRPPTAFYPRGSPSYATRGSSRGSRRSAGNTPPTTRPPTIRQPSYSSRGSNPYSRSVPIEMNDSPAPSSSGCSSFVSYRQESLQQITDSLERLAEAVQLVMRRVEDEQQAYTKACETGNCNMFN